MHNTRTYTDAAQINIKYKSIKIIHIHQLLISIHLNILIARKVLWQYSYVLPFPFRSQKQKKWKQTPPPAQPGAAVNKQHSLSIYLLHHTIFSDIQNYICITTLGKIPFFSLNHIFVKFMLHSKDAFCVVYWNLPWSQKTNLKEGKLNKYYTIHDLHKGTKD